MRPSLLLAMTSLLSVCGNASAFELKAENPDFAVTVPRSEEHTSELQSP